MVLLEAMLTGKCACMLLYEDVVVDGGQVVDVVEVLPRK